MQAVARVSILGEPYPATSFWEARQAKSTLSTLCCAALRQLALDYIGKRGSVPGVTRERRMQYAREILQRELLPHVAIEDFSETKKAYFFGYMVHRLLLVRCTQPAFPGSWGMPMRACRYCCYSALLRAIFAMSRLGRRVK
jgi:hypothetical protein